MNFFEKPFTFDRVVRIIITIIILTAIILALHYLSSVLIPFVIALILAYMMNPFVNLLQRLVKKRVIAVLLSLFIVLGIIATLIIIFIPLIAREVTHMADLVQNLVQETDLQAEIQTYLPANIADDVEAIIISKDIQKLFDSKEISNLTSFAAKKILPHVGNIFSETINVVIGIIGLAVIFLYLTFLLIDYNKVAVGWKTLIPPKHKELILGVIHDFEIAMNKYFRAQVLIATIIGTFAARA